MEWEERVNTNLKPNPARTKMGAVLIVLTGLLVGLGTPAFGQTDYDEKIEELEKALEFAPGELVTMANLARTPIEHEFTSG